MIVYWRKLGEATWRSSLRNTIEFDERLDEQLDSGSMQIINDTSEPFPDFCPIELFFQTEKDTKDTAETKILYFCAFDTVEQRANGYFIHNLELVEPTRLLMGVPIDGMRVTQPVNGTKKTLLDTLNRLLYVYTLDVKKRFSFSTDESLQTLFSSIDSPEFSWTAGTLLWECLLEIGNVVNAIPRLTINGDTNTFTVITFDEINKSTGEYELE